MYECMDAWDYGHRDYGWVRLWMHGIMDVWDYGCMRLWMHEIMDAWDYGCVGLWMRGITEVLWVGLDFMDVKFRGRNLDVTWICEANWHVCYVGSPWVIVCVFLEGMCV